MTRRHLLQSAAGVAGLAAIATSSSPAAAATCHTCPRRTVWHLETDWDQPRGPSGKTALVSRASRRAAQHRYALSESDALEMNLHLCSWAPAAPTEVCAEAFTGLWEELSYDWRNPWLGNSVRILDIRHVTRAADGEERLAHALLEEGANTTTCQPDGAVAAGIDVLPFTGISPMKAAVSGAGLLVTGLVALRMSRQGVQLRSVPSEVSESGERRRGRHLA